MPQALTHIGKYRLEGELGHGAMGVVYKAFDTVVERTVAIKTVRLDVDQPEELIYRLRREAKSVGQLEHPNIVTLYDAGEAEGLFYLAMQFIQGENLETRIARQGWFTPMEVEELFRQICAGLGYAHQHGVIHRDIKPANIMITREGVVKLTDFGIAKVLGGGTGISTHGLIVGTPSYMSPEQALGKPLDGRSDIFSLGSILYELMAREKAFPGQNTTTVMYKIVYEAPTPIRSLQPGLDPDIEAIVSRALAKNPAERFQNCAELASALELYVNKALASRPNVPDASLETVVLRESAPSRRPSPPIAAAPTESRRPHEDVSGSLAQTLAGPASASATPEGSVCQPLEAPPVVLPAPSGTASPTPLARPGPPWAWLGFGILGTLLLVTVILLVVQMRHPSRPEVVSHSPALQPTSPPQPIVSQPPSTPPGAGTTAPAATGGSVKPAPTSPPGATNPGTAAGHRQAQEHARQPTPAQKPSVPPATTTATGRPSGGLRVSPPAAPPAKGSESSIGNHKSSTPLLPTGEDFNSLALKGDLAFQQGKYQDALNAYSKAYKLDTSSREVRRKIAVTLTLLGRPQEAQKYK